MNYLLAICTVFGLERFSFQKFIVCRDHCILEIMASECNLSEALI